MSNEAFVSYRRSPLRRNPSLRCELDGLPIEASVCQQPRRLRAGAASRDDPLGACSLGLELAQCGFDQLGVDALSAQIEANRLAALPPLPASPRTAAGEAPVVESAYMAQLLE